MDSDITEINEMQKEEFGEPNQDRQEQYPVIEESYRDTELREYVHEGGIFIFS